MVVVQTKTRGFITTIIVVRELSLHTIPAFATDKCGYCSIASRMAVWSWLRMHPHSSMQQTPWVCQHQCPCFKGEFATCSMSDGGTGQSCTCGTNATGGQQSTRAQSCGKTQKTVILPVPGSPTKSR